MNEFPLKLKWKKNIREIPKLNLQFLETYLSKNDDDSLLQKQKQKRSKKKKIKKIVPRTLMQYFESDEKKKEEKEEDYLKNWKNLLIWGDNLYVLKSLEGKFRNKIQFVYIDPPFYTGANEYIDIPIGLGTKKTIKQFPSPIKDIAYKNIWTGSNHIQNLCQWFYERAFLIYKLLKDIGFMAVRFDYHYGHYIKVILDEIFGENNFICEYLVRRIYKPVSDKALERQKHLIIQVDSLFLYRKSNNAKFFEKFEKKKRKTADPIEYEADDDNIWIDIPGYEKTKKTLYPTENSISLLDRIIRQCSNKNDIIADFFCGSGTTVATGQELGRKWIAVDISRYSINEIRKRILLNSKSTSFPFQLLNLEMYNKHLLFLKLKSEEYIGETHKKYYEYILKQFKGSYLDGYDHLHGEINDAYIHIGGIDTIISPKEIQNAIEEVKSLNKNKLIILGWEYFMEVGFFKKLFQEDQKIEVELRIIPQSLINDEEENEHHFSELPFLEFRQSINPINLTIDIEFIRFHSNYHTTLYGLDLKDEESLDLIDFWAIDWDYNEEKLFRASDYSFRQIGSGRKIIKTAKTKIRHKYENAGSYTVVLTVVDIFGNETSEYFQLMFK